MKPSSMVGSTAGRGLNTPKLNYNETLLMGLNVSQKNTTLGVDLMQNCDLPPPTKVFTGSDDKTALSSMNRVYGLISTREEENQIEFDGEHHEKLELLKALRLSQTRAREAAKNAEVLARERDCLSDAMFKDAMKLFGHRQLVRLLELQVSSLYPKRTEREKKRRRFNGDHEGDDRGSYDSGVCLCWVVALAFSFGIAVVGFALGCSYLF